MTKEKAKSAGTTQPVDKQLFPEASQVVSLLDIQNKSIPSMTEIELVALLKELKIGLKALAQAQRSLGEKQKITGQSLKTARETRVRSKPATRKVVLSAEEYDRLKAIELSSKPSDEVEDSA